MRICKWDKGDEPNSSAGTMVFLTKQDAVSLIANLAKQMEYEDCNNNRKTFFTKNNEEFSIGVVEGEFLFRGEKITNDTCIHKDYDEDNNHCICENSEECFECGGDPDYCGCWDDIEEDDSEDDCECLSEDEFDKEFITDTFSPMNAFIRARWLKIQRKI